MIGEICDSPHLKRLVQLKDDMECKVYLEIGVLYGGSIIQLMKSDRECHFIWIDPFSGYYGRQYDPHRKVDLKDHIDIVKSNIDEANEHNHKYTLIKGKSNDTIEEVRKLNLKVDYLFIDGDHSKKGVIDDFINYKDFVNDSGIIAFDNYKDPNWNQVEEGVKYILENYEYKIIHEFGHCCVLQIK
jgi:hypothetical protein